MCKSSGQGLLSLLLFVCLFIEEIDDLIDQQDTSTVVEHVEHFLKVTAEYIALWLIFLKWLNYSAIVIIEYLAYCDLQLISSFCHKY